MSHTNGLFSTLSGVRRKIGIDATGKIHGEGLIRPWPDEMKMTEDVVRRRIEQRWSEYGL